LISHKDAKPARLATEKTHTWRPQRFTTYTLSRTLGEPYPEVDKNGIGIEEIDEKDEIEEVEEAWTEATRFGS